MKRIFSLFAAVLFAALIIAAPAAKAGGGPVVFSMNSVDNVVPGQTFTVTLSISGSYQAHGMNLSIEFDPNSMTLESCEKGGYLNGLSANNGIAVLDAEKLAPAGKIKLGVMMPTDPASGSGEVLIMKFHVNEGVTVNQQVIMIIQDFIYMPIGDNKGTPIPFSTHNSIITLNGGSTPEAGYNEGDDGIGNNLSSSPSQAPEPTQNSGATPAPGTTQHPIATVNPGADNRRQTEAPTSSEPQTSADASGQPQTTDEAASPTDGSAALETGAPDGKMETDIGRSGNWYVYVIIAAAVAAVGTGAFFFIRKMKK